MKGCRRNHFKWEAGSFACRQCPENSFTEGETSVECQCYNSYYRADKDEKSMPCTQPPSAPRNVKVVDISDTIVQLSWQLPEQLGGRTDTTYRVECSQCLSEVLYSPKAKGFNTTSVELKGLRASTKYTVKIYAENGVTVLSQLQPKYVQHEFTTESTIAEIQDIKLIDYGDNFIALQWQIKGQTSKGWGEFSSPFFASTRTPYQSEKELEPGPTTVIIVGAIVAVTLCMAIAGIMIFILIKRNRHRDGKNSDIDSPYHHVTVPLFQPSGTIKSYVDPHTYEDPNQAVREFTREIDASHIIIESVIGEFGDVCKGKLRVPSRPEMSVAIKTLKAGATDKNRLDFLTEASIMGQFDDPNVIFLEGVVTKASPIMIVTEYMANGSLDSFLRK
ncbi:EPA4B-like protein [Mya arenaria]|uniref:EPA4B-like protein n=1 Tax=Mya arenaria TaxID=6604 RepID=A0ABY7EYP3_MYAAR|nr:EPA4B-like protein [Mya arenaria]